MKYSLVSLIFWRDLCCCCCQVVSVVSDSVRPHRRQPTRLLCPWDSPGKNNGVGCHFLLYCVKVKSESEVAQSCPILSDPIDCSPPGSSVHGTLQARALEWGAIAFSKTFLFYFLPLFLCIDRWGKLSYLSLLFFGMLHSNGYSFPILLCFSLLFFSQLFVRPPPTAILLFLHFFLLGMVLIPVSCRMSWTSFHSSSVTLSIRFSP